MLKLKNADDEKSKLKLKEGNKRISEINSEALALSLAYNNAAFLFTVVLFAFFIMRSAPPASPGRTAPLLARRELLRPARRAAASTGRAP